MRPSLIVVHYTAMSTCRDARARLCDPTAEVSAHWLVSETGQTEALVNESARAWHAGAGEWAGITDVNSASIGIELANTGTQPFPEPQMAALETLLAEIMARWTIPAHRIIAHSDMAPMRKGDPGPRFDWHRLAISGLSVWPLPGHARLADFVPALRKFGYPQVPDTDLLAVFRLRFRPWAHGPLDSTDAALAFDLATRFGM